MINIKNNKIIQLSITIIILILFSQIVAAKQAQLKNALIIANTFPDDEYKNQKNYPSEDTIFLTGIFPWTGQSLYTTRSLLSFNLADIENAQTAKLVVVAETIDPAFSTNIEQVLEIYKITQPWPTKTTWNTAQNIEKTLITTTTIKEDKVYEIDITQLVKQWLQNPNSNYGILLKAQDENSVNLKQFINAYIQIEEETRTQTCEEAGGTCKFSLIGCPTGEYKIENQCDLLKICCKQETPTLKAQYQESCTQKECDTGLNCKTSPYTQDIKTCCYPSDCLEDNICRPNEYTRENFDYICQNGNWTQKQPSQNQTIPQQNQTNPYCGDGTCNKDENCNTCSADCGNCLNQPGQCVVAEYNFNDGSGKIIHDSSGKGNNGTIYQSHGGPSTYGAFWETENDNNITRQILRIASPGWIWIETPGENFPDSRQGFTLEVWVKAISGFTPNNPILSKYNGLYWLGTCGIPQSPSADNICFGVLTTEGDYTFWGETTKLYPNKWYKLKVEFDGKNVKLYVNDTVNETLQILYRNSFAPNNKISVVEGEILNDKGPLMFSPTVENIKIDYARVVYNNCSIPPPKPPMLIGNYHFDENYVDWMLGENALTYDSGQYKNDGTILVDNSFGAGSVSVTNGIKGKAYYFDGNDLISINRKNVLDFDDFTIEVWIKPTAVGPTTEDIISSTPLIRLNSAAGGNCLYVEYDSYTYFTSNFCNFKNNEWYHIALVKEGADLKLYINGTLDTNKSLGRKYPYLFSRVIYIGAEPRSSDSRYRDYGFTGTIDELKFYNYAKNSFDLDKNIAYTGEVCDDNSDCQSGLDCKEDFYAYRQNIMPNCWQDCIWEDQRHFKRCCAQGGCLYDTNCYANGAEAHNNAYVCTDGEWKSKKKTTGNIVLNLTLNEGNGITANDFSGFNNKGILSESSLWTDGYSGKGIDFSNNPTGGPAIDAKMYRINVKNSPSINLSYNIKLDTWVKFYDDVCCPEYNPMSCGAWCPKGGGGLMSTRRSEILGLKEYGYILFWNSINGSRKFCFNIHTDVYENQQVCSNTTYVSGQWYHVIATYDGDYLKMYVNGILENSVPARGGIIYNNYDLVIGSSVLRIVRGNPPGTLIYSAGLNGIMDEVKIYNYVPE